MLKFTSIIVTTVFALGQVFGFSPYNNSTQNNTSTLRPLSNALSAEPVSITPQKLTFSFSQGKADGDISMKNELGGKGAGLAEMGILDLPVPPGFTIPAWLCNYYYDHDRTYPPGLKEAVLAEIEEMESIMGQKYGDPDNPLLVSARSGARQSMPGMMDTVLNLGLTSKTIPGLLRRSGGNKRFVYDSYRRVIHMYADVVMEKAAGIEPAPGKKEIGEQLEHILQHMKDRKGVENDTDLTGEDLEDLCNLYKERIEQELGIPFPDDHEVQLWGDDKTLGAIGAVFASWNGKRAKEYRKIEGIPDDWGTAVNVQAMVFGNMDDSCATGVGFTRDPATGKDVFFGEYLKNAQGEDVVAGTRTPQPINSDSVNDQNKDLPVLEDEMSELYQELVGIITNLEKHSKDMLDIEFTIEQGKLWMLQYRVGKRTANAAVKIALDMYKEKLITAKEAVMRVTPELLDMLLHPMLDPKAEKAAKVIGKGLPAGPGGAVGRAVFTADDAETWAKERKEKVILVRVETSPEDVHGMAEAEGILTARGGMTSHAALVARGWGKTCVSGASDIDVDVGKKQFTASDGRIIKEGDWLSLNGTAGLVYGEKIGLIEPNVEENTDLEQLLEIADTVAVLDIRTNTDSPAEATQARNFGAKGIGLTRTEHMFFDPKRITSMRKMILAETDEERDVALAELLPYQKQDFIGILKAMQGLPVTIRLLDPPLHEFLPQDEETQKKLAKEMPGVSLEKLQKRIEQLHEANPMLGHRGVRLAVSYPAIARMQVRAVFEAAAELELKGIKVYPEIMIPLVIVYTEMKRLRGIVEEEAQAVEEKYGVKLNYNVGTMIEIPRAAITADQIAEYAEFFSFGTNDLTQTALGLSRDDSGRFLPDYVEGGLLKEDPFQSIDREGVGELMRIGKEKGRATRPGIKIGICGEHGGDPASIEFCHILGLDYVSCSPFRVPIARLAAAQAAVRFPKEKKASDSKASSAGIRATVPRAGYMLRNETSISTAIGQAA